MAKKAKKKPGKLLLLRRAYKELGREAAGYASQVNSALARVHDLEIQLGEARRRTIPMGPGQFADEINFLPSYIESVDFKNDVREMQTLSGFRSIIGVSHRAIIHCIGEIVYLPGPVTKT
jgi:hypothetical protein